MPRNGNYKNGKIYSIRSHQTDEIYIGSTTISLSQRLSKHKNNYKRYLADKNNYITSFKILENDDAYIELVEEFPCDSRMQLCKREGEIIRATENCVNRCIAGRTGKEYREENKERIKEYLKQYDISNKDKLNEYRKQYREANKDKIKEYHKKYRVANKDKINKQQSQRTSCDCGGRYRRGDKSSHERTLKHQAYLNSLSPS